MTRDPRPTGYDDATIEQLVRDVAGEWTMPPVRLDAPGWRSRVRSPGARRLAAVGGVFGRLGRAAGAAVTLTVVAALIAVIITRPPSQPGKSPEPSGGPSASPAANATALPKLLVNGDEPNPAIVMMRRENGDFARVDLTTGSINGPITRKSSFSELRVGPGGTLLCLCVEESGSIGGQPTDDIVSLDRFDARGKLTSSTPIDELSGEPDPRDASIFVPERPPHVVTSIGFSDDGRYGFVGWSLRAHPVWHSGVIVVDLATGSIVSRLALPDSTDGEGDRRRVVDAPRVVGTIDTGTVLIARFFYEWTPPESQQPSVTFENHVFTASLDGGTLGDARLVPTASDCGGLVIRAGSLPESGYWLACSSSPELTVVRRLSRENSLIGDIRVPGSPGVDTDPTAVSADGRSLYVWNPSEGALTRVDLASGDSTTGKGIASTVDRGPLAAFGDWLAPTAAAKSWLRGALAISPDGSRVYAIGIKHPIDESEMAGSAGVFVFDAATLDPIAIWQPTADFVSIAVSPDGSFVYAAGLPGFDFTGTRRIRQQASITVFDATDGAVRLIAGQLGGDALTFLGPTLD